MMITTLGASLGARTGSGNAGFESLIVRPITPLKRGGSGGSFPAGSLGDEWSPVRRGEDGRKDAVTTDARRDAGSLTLAQAQLLFRSMFPPREVSDADDSRRPVEISSGFVGVWAIKSTMTCGQLGAVRFLNEMAGAFDDRVRLVLATGDFSLKALVAAAGDRIVIAESGQKRLLPLAKHLPGLLVRFLGGVVGRRRARVAASSTGQP